MYKIKSPLIPKVAALTPICGLNLTLNMKSMKIINLGDPINTNDAINVRSLNDKVIAAVSSLSDGLNVIPLNGTQANAPVTGNLIFNGTASITGIRDPVEPSDAMNLQSLNTKLTNSYANIVRLDGSVKMTGALDMLYNSILNLAYPIDETDMSTVKVYSDFAPPRFLKVVPLTGLPTPNISNILSDLTVSGVITGIADPVNPQDAVTLKRLGELFTFSPTGLFRVDGTLPMTGNLNMGGNKITGVPDPAFDTDLCNLNGLNAYITQKTAKLTPLSRAVMLGDISVASVKQAKDPTEYTQALTKGYMTTYLANHLNSLPKLGATLIKVKLSADQNTNFLSEKDFNTSRSYHTDNLMEIIHKAKKSVLRRTGHSKTRIINYDKITGRLPLETRNFSEPPSTWIMNSYMNNYLPITGGSMAGPLNMNSGMINNLKYATNPNAVVSHKQLSNSYLRLNGFNKFSGVLNMENQVLSIKNDPIHSDDPINMSYITANPISSKNITCYRMDSDHINFTAKGLGTNHSWRIGKVHLEESSDLNSWFSLNNSDLNLNITLSGTYFLNFQIIENDSSNKHWVIELTEDKTTKVIFSSPEISSKGNCFRSSTMTGLFSIKQPSTKTSTYLQLRLLNNDSTVYRLSWSIIRICNTVAPIT